MTASTAKHSGRLPKGMALLIVDMINPLDFEGGAAMLPHALAAAKRIATLRKRLTAQDVPVVYVNDNFMQWQVDFNAIVAHCRRDTLGSGLADLLAPQPGDYFILKPKHSGFFATPLPILLDKLEVGRLVITGAATDGCVLATAMDAHMHEFDVHVPRDCVAAITRERSDRALALMKDAVHIDVRSARYAKP